MSKPVKKNKRFSLLFQISIFFIIGLIMTIALSSFMLKRVADTNVIREKETMSSGIASDVERSVKEYAAYDWVVRYLIEHKDDPDLDLEYDYSEYTKYKIMDLISRHDGLVISKVSSEIVKGFSDEDQKLFAEIVFNRWLMRLNDIKKSYDVSFLYFFATDDNYQEDIFLVSASDGTMIRGKEMGNAYVLGTMVENNPDQASAFSKLHEGDHLVYTNGFLDRYRYMFRAGDMNVITGVTFDITEIRREVENQTYQSIINFAIFQFMLFIFCLVLIYFIVLKPLDSVRRNVYRYMDEKDGTNARESLSKIKSRNEIGALSTAFSDMTSEIDGHITEIQTITAEKERIGAELDVATKIQSALLPSDFPAFPDVKEIDVYATMDPAREVGGDFYDFFMVDQDHVALVMADVSGKGIPAALFMAIAKTLIKNRALMGGAPSEILYDVNKTLCDGNTLDFFVTVWLAIIDIKTGKGVAANAGHEHPVIRRAGGQYELVIYKHSLAVAAMDGVRFKEHDFELHPGDRILVYTDGVPEATNADNELFGPDRMIASLNKDPEAKITDVLSNLKKDIDEFVGDHEQFDDMTMLVFDYGGPDANTL